MLSKGFVLAALLGWKEARDHQGWGGWFVAGLFGIFSPPPSIGTQIENNSAVAALEAAAFEVLPFICKG